MKRYRLREEMNGIEEPRIAPAPLPFDAPLLSFVLDRS